MNRTFHLILTSLFIYTLSYAQESPQMSLFAHGYEDESNFVVYQAPSQADAELLTQFKEYTIKDNQGRDIKITVSPYYYRNPAGQSMISFQGMQLDSSFTWETSLSFAPAKEVKKEFPIQESSQRIQFNGFRPLSHHPTCHFYIV